MKEIIRKAARVTGAMLIIAAILGGTVAACSFDNGDITYGQAWARLLSWALAGTVGAVILNR